ncbi:SIR2 family protein [Nocardioides marinus]|nr:SIR2 family protein [Nocardioides marinus]
MSEYFEIAYAAASKRLCLFTGTGFSMALTENEMPGWQELLEEVCDKHFKDSEIKDTLFPDEENNPLQLEEAAEVIGLELERNEKNIHEEISKIVGDVKVAGSIENVSEFFKKRSFRVVTTNYDKISEELSGSDCQSLSPGLPVPRSNSRVKVFHVHGSIDYPSRMVVTSSDYFEFMGGDSYFSQKLSTILHENTVVILGYSLGDTNLKTILNNYSGFMKSHNVSSSIFFVSRKAVPQPIADYYAACYGIRVIGKTEVDEFFRKVENKYASAEKVIDRSIKGIKKVLHEGATFKDTFLQQDYSFYQVISAIGAIGESLESGPVVEMFGHIIDTKKKLCKADGAWEQYVQLASWLTHLGSLIEIKGRSIEDNYLSAVKFSMETMTSTRLLGYSWHAYSKWDRRWRNITGKNRAMIKGHIEAISKDPDALKIVSRG